MFAFNGLLVGAMVILAYLPIRALPDRRQLPETIAPLSYQAVGLPPALGPFRLAGAWVAQSSDTRFAGLSALALDCGRFIAVSDLGAVMRFDPPTARHPKVAIRDLSIGPGPFGKKWSRDAESLARDPRGRGWWVGYEQTHSLWLYDDGFGRSLGNVRLRHTGWRDNRGAEGLIADRGMLLVTAENGRDAIAVSSSGVSRRDLNAGADVAEAALAPDGSAWLLLRSKGMHGISQSIAPLLPFGKDFRVGAGWRLPKAAFDNFEGMTIALLPDGSWRFWLVTDDGHRVMARTLLVALDYAPPAHSKSPATSAGPSNEPSAKTP